MYIKMMSTIQILWRWMVLCWCLSFCTFAFAQDNKDLANSFRLTLDSATFNSMMLNYRPNDIQGLLTHCSCNAPCTICKEMIKSKEDSCITNTASVSGGRVHLENLLSDTTYAFKFMLVKEGDLEPSYLDQCFKTRMLPPPPVDALRMVEIASNTALVTWQCPNTIKCDSFEITVYQQSRIQKVYRTNLKRLNITELEPETEYNISVVIHTIDNSNDHRQEMRSNNATILFKTLQLIDRNTGNSEESPVALPLNLMLLSASATTLTVRWDSTNDENYPSSKRFPVYKVCIREQENNENIRCNQTNATSFTFENLHPETKYEITLVSLNNDPSIGALSSQIAAATDVVQEGAPMGVIIGGVVGGILGICLITIIVLVVIKYIKTQSEQEELDRHVEQSRSFIDVRTPDSNPSV